ncbi:DUF3781 domain-containing protein [uncultured Acetobacteroides sp.]|uniref:DUF3781 domain-containing protein n=1 Tax=uncultured Acetobacteroides sp. TaxID=1760811 RepID=UPI0029F521EC|nr:DUF3781 domain-containing protein [uncultured Acetobacteroides sp.]
MDSYKAEVLKRVCYTELVYGRINKKLNKQLSKEEIEKMIFETLEETNESQFEKIGKNIYVTNCARNIRITVNTNTYRIITVDAVASKKE